MGHRVELLSTNDQYTKLKAGDRGDLLNIRFDPIDKVRILDVKWDSGSTLSLIEGQDRWRVFEE